MLEKPLRHVRGNVEILLVSNINLSEGENYRIEVDNEKMSLKLIHEIMGQNGILGSKYKC